MALKNAFENVATQATLAALLADSQAKADLLETQPVSVVSLPLPSGGATSAKQDTAQTRFNLLATEATIAGVDTKAGSLTETAPGTDTASSGLNGRLQRVAQRLTSLIALLPVSLGQKVKAASFAVTIASDQDALTTRPSTVSTAANGSVTVGVTSVEIRTANTARIEATICNDHATNIVYLALGAVAVVNKGVRLNPGGGEYTTPPGYTGTIEAVATGATTNVTFTEA